MANTIVTGDQYMQIDDKIREIKRQLRQRNGYPFSPRDLELALQRIVEGELLPEASGAQPTTARSEGLTWILKIDRSIPFNPAMFIGKGWSIWRGHAYGNGHGGDEQQSKKSLVLSEVDITKIKLKTCLDQPTHQKCMNGEEFLRRLKRGARLLLDAKVGQTLLENPHCIPEDWRFVEVCFMGTELRSPDGDRYILRLNWSGERWHYSPHQIDNYFYAVHPAVVGGVLHRSRAT